MRIQKQVILTLLLCLVFALTGCDGGGGGGGQGGGGADTTPPAISSKSPDNAASAVAINSSIVVTFSEAVDATTVNSATFTVKDTSNNAVSGTVTCNGASATFTPSQNLAVNTTYTVTIAAGIKDSAGNATTSESTWTFTTGTSTADTTPPTVISTNPISNATGVAANSTVTATFSEAMDSASITSTTFTLKDALNNPISGAVSYNDGNNTAAFTPSASLADGTVYTATITTGVRDAAGNPLPGDIFWSFTTSAQLAAVDVCSTSSSINSATTWAKGSVYVVGCTLSVNSVLTIEPGAVVKFKPTYSMSIGGSGVLVANGTATDHIIFTSYKDDTYGGDTNGEGSATSPAAGDWNKIYLNAAGATASLDYCEFYYSGSSSTGIGIDLNSYSATIKNSTFAYNKGGTLASPRGVIDASSAASGTVITGNTFHNNAIPLTISALFSVDDSNVFHNPANSAQTNTYNGIFLPGTDISGSITWAETEVPFVLEDNQSIISAGGVLTLGDNVVLKFGAGDYLYSQGVIIANASVGQQVVFTSINDDTYGGDTNGDGNTTSPAASDWGGITLGADNSVFNRIKMFYTSKDGIDLYTYSATITNSTFAYNGGGTLASPSGVINAATAGTATVITGNIFHNNAIPLTINDTFSLDDSNIFHNPANAQQTNTYNGIFLDSGIDISGSITWAETEVPFVMEDNQTMINTGATLTLGDNVVLKFGAGDYLYNDNGSIVQGTGNWFTSLKDDSILGDTNGDGNATSPATGDWDGINYWSGSTSSCWYGWSNILYQATHTTYCN